MPKKYTINDLVAHAKDRNRLCLTSEYFGCKSNYLWQCDKKHQWEATWDNILNEGTGCPYCSRRVLPDISKLISWANIKNGILHSIAVSSVVDPLLWECSKGHQWNANWNHISSGTWCPKCNGTTKPNILECQQWAISKHGSLLSTTYVNARSSLLWKCNKGHEWNACWDKISHGQWCPSCQTLKSERECISLAETILNILLVKKRIHYTVNELKYFLTFDGYNEEHKIAVEYNGIQHYKYIPFFHKTEQDFIYQQERDNRKRNYCKENNITLIEVPYTESNREQFIRLYLP